MRDHFSSRSIDWRHPAVKGGEFCGSLLAGQRRSDPRHPDHPRRRQLGIHPQQLALRQVHPARQHNRPTNLRSTPSHAWSRTIACRCAATPTPATGSAPGARPAGTSPATCCRSAHLSGCPRGGVARLGRSPGVRHRCLWHQKTQASGRGITRYCSASADHSSPRHYWPSTLHRRRSAVSSCAAVWQQLSSGLKES